MITVKVIRVPGAVKDVALEEGATVAEALSAAGESTSSTESVTLNGAASPVDTALSDGDRVIIAKAAKGN